LQDPRFDDEVDRIMGYYTSSLLCMPVKNSYEEIIAVAQVNNKNPDKDDGHFTSMDEKVNIFSIGVWTFLRVVLTQSYF
jgi:dual 3',5'-cyclic-AMP and -GMP phosphodiesterase 11